MNIFSSPLFVDGLLYSLYALLTVAVLLVVWGAVRSWRQARGGRERSSRLGRGIAWGVLALVACVLGLTFLTASTRPITANGTVYADPLWLRLSDMLINTALILMAIAVAGVLWGFLNMRRPWRGNRSTKV